MSEQRLKALRERIRQAGIDGLLVSAKANRRYISGFSGSEGYLLITQDRAALLSDSRYALQGRREAPGFEFHQRPSSGIYSGLLSHLVLTWQVRRLGFEAEALSYANYARFEEQLRPLGVQLLPSGELVEGLREVKDAQELGLLRRAIAITDKALAATLPLIRPAMRERELAWELEKAMHERGASGLAFEFIVAAGPNAARPHARPGDDQLGIGRPVIIDCGALYQGYHADMTRTVILGEADERFQQIYGVVLEALERAEQGLRAGLNGDQADWLARYTITAAGYEQAFGHALGHGVGLEIHEGPRLRRGNEATLPAGSVVSIEPGIYLEGWGGVRIEDLALVLEQSCEILTGSPRSAPVLPI